MNGTNRVGSENMRLHGQVILKSCSRDRASPFGTDFKANLALKDVAPAAIQEERAVEVEVFRPDAGLAMKSIREDRPPAALPEVFAHA
jgi:hypothetical protein